MTDASAPAGPEAPAPAPPPPPLGATHHRRLHEVWRSAGWPCHDAIELDLPAAAVLSRHRDAEGRERLRVTDAGIPLLAATRRRNRAAFAARKALVAREALEMQRAGRIAWRGLSLRAPLPRDDGDNGQEMRGVSGAPPG